jgi:hypothetical protein
MTAKERRKSRPPPDNRRAKFCLKINAKVFQRPFFARRNAGHSRYMLKPGEQTLKMLRIVGEEHVSALFQEGCRRRIKE